MDSGVERELGLWAVSGGRVSGVILSVSVENSVQCVVVQYCLWLVRGVDDAVRGAVSLYHFL